MKGDISKLMQQAQKMQTEVKQAQQEIANMVVEGQAGAGMVKVTMDGKHAVRRVEIDSSIWQDNDKEMLEDLIAAGFNAAVQELERVTKARLKNVTQGFELPADFNLAENIED